MEMTRHGRYIHFTHEDRTVKFDLQTGEKISWTGKSVKSLGAFFRKAGIFASTYWNRSQDPLTYFDRTFNHEFLAYVRAKAHVRSLDGILRAWPQYYDAEKWFSLGYSPSRWNRIFPVSIIPKRYHKLEWSYYKLCYCEDMSHDRLNYIYDKFDGNADKIYHALEILNRHHLSGEYKKREIDLALEMEMDLPYRMHSYKMRDSIKLAHQLGYKITAKDLSASAVDTCHDMLDRDYKLKKDEIANERFLESMTDEWDWHDDKFLVRYPLSTSEVVDEGKKLGHCVASYVSQIGERMSILFLRSVDKPDEPLLTLERKDEALWQARGNYNRSATDEERKFLDKYCDKKKLTRRGYSGY